MRKSKTRATVTNEHRRYRRRAHNHKVRRSRRTRHLVRNAAGLLAKATGTLVLVLVALSLYEEVSTSPRYAVRDIQVTGTDRRDPEVIRARLAHFLGHNMFRVSLGSVAGEAEGDPWVLAAAVRRVLPGTLQVSVTEREPVILVAASSGIWLADKTGVLLGRAEADDFPVVTGVFDEGSGASARRIRLGMAACLAVRRILPWLYRELSEIHIEEGDRLRLVVRDPPTTLICDGDAFERQLVKYSRASNLLASYAPGATTLDLRFRDRLIAKVGDSGSNRRQSDPQAGGTGRFSVEEKSHG